MRDTEGEMVRRKARFPDRKISETFLHFAEPLLHELPSEAPEHYARKDLRMAFTVWNAVVFADVLKNDRHLDEVLRLTADQPEPALVIERLVARKRALFADDERLIGNWELTCTDDRINLNADAQDPHSLLRVAT